MSRRYVSLGWAACVIAGGLVVARIADSRDRPAQGGADPALLQRQLNAVVESQRRELQQCFSRIDGLTARVEQLERGAGVVRDVQHETRNDRRPAVSASGSDDRELAVLDSALSRQTNDPTWKAQLEKLTSTALRDLGLNASVRAQLRCSRALCRVLLTDDGDVPAFADGYLASIPHGEGVWRRVPDASGAGRTLVYLTKPQVALADALARQD